MDIFPAGSTVPLFFTTNAASGAAVAPSTAFEAADVKLYKGASATERSSTAGWTMTSPFDSITGLHLLAIDTSDNTDAGFYAEGNIYTAVLSPDETVDSQAVVAVIGRFWLGPVNANVTQISGDATAADNLESYTDGTTPMPVDATQISGDATAADNAEAMFDGTGYAGGAIKLRVDTVGISNDSTAADTLELFVEALDQATGKIATSTWVAGAIDNAAFATGALTAGKIAADAIGASQLAADAAAEVAAAVLAGAITIPSAPPTAPYTVDDVLGWLLAIIKFARAQTATTETVYGDDGTTSIGTAAKADNGTTFTRAEYS